MTTPKWTELAVKWGDFEAKLAKSELQLNTLISERNQLNATTKDALTKIAALTAEMPDPSAGLRAIQKGHTHE